MSNREIAALSTSVPYRQEYLFRIFDKLGVSSRTELLYLTMNDPQVRQTGGQPGTNGESNAFAAIVASAEAGDAPRNYAWRNTFPRSKTLRAVRMDESLACKPPRFPPTCVSACRKSGGLDARTDRDGKKNIRLTMSPSTRGGRNQSGSMVRDKNLPYS